MENNEMFGMNNESFVDRPQFVLKKDGVTREDWNPAKLLTAAHKSADRVGVPMTEQEDAEFVALVEGKCMLEPTNVVPVARLHTLVVEALQEVRPDVAKSYQDYRSISMYIGRKMMESMRKANSIMFLGDKENANKDAAMASTKGALLRDILTQFVFEESFLTPAEKEAVEVGYVYIHDIAQRYFMPMNCCLFDVKTVLTGGFNMGNMFYNEPKSLDTAFDVVGDIVMNAASQQYGGFTLPRIDEVLARYAEKTYQKALSRYTKAGLPEEQAKALAEEDVASEAKQGYQGWEYKFNTVASSRGDYPFVAITFGIGTGKWEKLLAKTILRVHREGQGEPGKKVPVLFPKLIFLYDENLHCAGGELEDVYEEALETSSRTMYPDWLSLTGEGYVPSMYKKYGKKGVVSPMGCRAFLSPWYERGGAQPADDDDQPVFEGRFNIGAVSLNLPMIYAKAQREGKDFYEVLDFYLEMIRKFHIRTRDYIGNMKASCNPLAFCEGGFYGGHLGYDDKIRPLLDAATASFGITALNELEQIAHGKSIREDGSFSLEVMEYINQKLQEFKAEDHILYAVYGTPAESLCGKQVVKFREQFGIVNGVSDRPYVTNSFHCHVTEDMSPIEKQDKEERFWNLFNGGKIQYVRYPLGYNKEAIRSLVRRAMKKGFYEGVNLSLAYCSDCGHEQPEMDICPKCGSRNITKIDRMNGYLAFSRTPARQKHAGCSEEMVSYSRLNDAKNAEIADRVSM